MPDIKEQLQTAILKLLSESGLSERELATSLGVSQSYINKIKNGKSNLKPLEMFFKLIEQHEIDFSPSLLPASTRQTRRNEQSVLVFTSSPTGISVQLVSVDELLQ